MRKKNALTAILPTGMESLSDTINASIEKLLGLNISDSFNKNKIIIKLIDYGIGKEAACHIEQNTADIAWLKQRDKDLQQKLEAVRGNSVAQELKINTLSAEVEELSRLYSALTEQQRAENAEYQEKLANIQEKYSAEISRIKTLSAERNSQIEQVISDIQDMMERGVEKERAAEMANELLVKEITALKREIKELENKIRDEIINKKTKITEDNVTILESENSDSNLSEQDLPAINKRLRKIRQIIPRLKTTIEKNLRFPARL